MLQEPGLNLEIENSHYQSVLYMAVEMESAIVTLTLLDSGADPNSIYQGFPMLTQATASGASRDIIQVRFQKHIRQTTVDWPVHAWV